MRHNQIPIEETIYLLDKKRANEGIWLGRCVTCDTRHPIGRVNPPETPSKEAKSTKEPEKALIIQLN